MKTTLFFTLLILFNIRGLAQEVGVQLTDNFKGKNASIVYSFENKQKNWLYGGVIIHINEDIKTSLRQNYMFKKRFRSSNASELFGLELGYKHQIKVFNEYNSLYLDGNTQITRLSLLNYMFLDSELLDGSGHKYEGTLEEDQYVLVTLKTGAMRQIENNIGLTLKTELTKNITTNFSIGTGFIGVKHNDPRVQGDRMDWFTHRVSILISYNIKGNKG